MALKSVVTVEVEKNEFLYTFSMPAGRPLQECYDACAEVSKEIVEFSQQLQEQDKKNAEAAKEAGETPEVVEGEVDVSKE